MEEEKVIKPYKALNAYGVGGVYMPDNKISVLEKQYRELCIYRNVWRNRSNTED